jgi:protein phosphatase
MRSVNEDAVSLTDLVTGWSASGGNIQDSRRTRAAVVGVYDGTGSAGPEASASHHAARIFCERMAAPPAPASGAELSQRLQETTHAAHDAVYEVSARSRVGSGTTATIAAIAGAEVAIVHVGDSRGYLFSGGALRQVTRDDTLVRELIEAGHLTPAEAATFPHRNVVTRVLGFTGRLDSLPITSLSLRPGDVLLLCTDGIWGMVDDAAIAAILAAQPDPAAACRALIEAANDAGGPDNASAVVSVYDQE